MKEAIATGQTTIIPPFVMGVDLGRPGGDRTAEMVMEYQPDGTLRVIECWMYGKTIEGAATDE